MDRLSALPLTSSRGLPHPDMASLPAQGVPVREAIPLAADCTLAGVGHKEPVSCGRSSVAERYNSFAQTVSV
jgi:hypothetical protein